jgi:hypothetical protein
MASSSHLLPGTQLLVAIEERSLTHELAWLVATGQRLKGLLADTAVYMATEAAEGAGGEGQRPGGLLLPCPEVLQLHLAEEELRG